MAIIGLSRTFLEILEGIKQQCDACKAITEIASKCADNVQKIKVLVKTMRDGAEVLQNTPRISTALNQRREDFNAIVRSLEKMKEATKPRHPFGYTKKFIKAQGWEKEIGNILKEIFHLRNGVETIVTNYDVAIIAGWNPKVSVRAEATQKKKLGREDKNKETVSFNNRTKTTMAKLSDASRTALHRRGYLDRLSLPEALFRASLNVHPKERKSHIELLQRSAELLHPAANDTIGRYYKQGYGVERNNDIALYHFKVASSRGHSCAMIRLMEHYELTNDRRNLMKYIKMAGSIPLQRPYWDVYVKYAIEYGFQGNRSVQPMIGASQYESAFSQSLCYFFGVGVAKSNLKAVDALRSFDSASYEVSYDFISDRLHIKSCHFTLFYCKIFSSMREYLDFLFQGNQFLPFLTLSYGTQIYSPKEWERYAVGAANSHCVEAHVFLAVHYHSMDPHKNKREVKWHLQIAAGAGHSEAQSIYRQLFRETVSVSTRERLTEGRHCGIQEKGRHWPRAKQSEKNSENLRKNRVAQASKKHVLATKFIY